MKALVCELCNGNDFVKQDGVFVCQFCGTKYTLEEAKKLQAAEDVRKPILVFLHFPPVWGDFVCSEILTLLKEFEVDTCYFGHIHGAYHVPRTRTVDGIDFVLCAADYLNFAPMPVWVE
jgi:predicted phosphohydrolase